MSSVRPALLRRTITLLLQFGDNSNDQWALTSEVCKSYCPRYEGALFLTLEAAEKVLAVGRDNRLLRPEGPRDHKRRIVGHG